jgi:hypothetical protein
MIRWQFDIWNGANWVNLLTWNENHTAGEFVSLDLGAYVGMSDLQVRYRYAGNGWDWYAQVDNVAIRCEGAFFGVAVSDHEPVTADPAATASHTVTITNTGTMQCVVRWHYQNGRQLSAPKDGRFRLPRIASMCTD